ncbi:MAG: hypothetical protein WCE82_08905 [Halobacteriota archaeon]
MAGPAMIGSTNSLTSDERIAVGNTYSFGVGLQTSGLFRWQRTRTPTVTFARHTRLSIYVLTTLYPFSEGIRTRRKTTLIAFILAILVIGSTAVVSAAPKKKADEVTFTVTDEQRNALQQTHPTEEDANVQPVHHEMMPTAAGKESSNVASQGAGRSPMLVGAAPAVQWDESHGGSSYGWAREVQQTNDGGYILVGSSNSQDYGSQLYLKKVNATGQPNASQKTWGALYGGPSDEYGYSVHQTSDGGYIAVGSTSSLSARHGSDVYLLKVNAAGSVQWERIYGGARDDCGCCVRQTADGGYVICGHSNSWTSHSNYDAYLIKTDKNGNITYPSTWQMSTDTNVPLEAITPATQLTALYAEYDGLLDALEEVERKLKSTSRLNPLTRNKLRRQRDNLCETLADVHEKIADFDFVLM